MEMLVHLDGTALGINRATDTFEANASARRAPAHGREKDIAIQVGGRALFALELHCERFVRLHVKLVGHLECLGGCVRKDVDAALDEVVV